MTLTVKRIGTYPTGYPEINITYTDIDRPTDYLYKIVGDAQVGDKTAIAEINMILNVPMTHLSHPKYVKAVTPPPPRIIKPTETSCTVTITDITNKPLGGVTAVLDGDVKITDMDGRAVFTALSPATKDMTFTFSAMGYVTRKFVVKKGEDVPQFVTYALVTEAPPVPPKPVVEPPPPTPTEEKLTMEKVTKAVAEAPKPIEPVAIPEQIKLETPTVTDPLTGALKWLFDILTKTIKPAELYKMFLSIFEIHNATYERMFKAKSPKLPGEAKVDPPEQVVRTIGVPIARPRFFLPPVSW